MSNNIHHISKVEIEGLWGRFDLSWDLNADVNVLSGINGSGKSTILNCVAQLILNGTLSKSFYKLFNRIEVFFNNKASIALTDINGTLNVGTAGSNEMTLNDMFSLENGFQKKIKIDFISTFDQEILNRDIELSSEKNIRTELDVDIFKLQKKYLDYQLNIGKRFLI